MMKSTKHRILLYEIAQNMTVNRRKVWRGDADKGWYVEKWYCWWWSLEGKDLQDFSLSKNTTTQKTTYVCCLACLATSISLSCCRFVRSISDLCRSRCSGLQHKNQCVYRDLHAIYGRRGTLGVLLGRFG